MMKVVAFNGSPRPDGNTYFNLRTVADQLEQAGIQTEIVHVGKGPLRGCTACGGCRTLNGRCALPDDGVNECVQKLREADGLLLGCPVYYAGISGTMKCFLDRLFYVNNACGNHLRHKVGAAVVAVRRSGGVFTFDALNHYLLFAEMFIPASNYWNVGHGRLPGEVEQDTEAVQTMQILGENMGFLMKRLAGEDAAPPAKREKIYTNFVR